MFSWPLASWRETGEQDGFSFLPSLGPERGGGEGGPMSKFHPFPPLSQGGANLVTCLVPTTTVSGEGVGLVPTITG